MEQNQPNKSSSWIDYSKHPYVVWVTLIASVLGIVSVALLLFTGETSFVSLTRNLRNLNIKQESIDSSRQALVKIAKILKNNQKELEQEKTILNSKIAKLKSDSASLVTEKESLEQEKIKLEQGQEKLKKILAPEVVYFNISRGKTQNPIHGVYIYCTEVDGSGYYKAELTINLADHDTNQDCDFHEEGDSYSFTYLKNRYKMTFTGLGGQVYNEASFRIQRVQTDTY